MIDGINTTVHVHADGVLYLEDILCEFIHGAIVTIYCIYIPSSRLYMVT